MDLFRRRGAIEANELLSDKLVETYRGRTVSSRRKSIENSTDDAVPPIADM